MPIQNMGVHGKIPAENAHARIFRYISKWSHKYFYMNAIRKLFLAKTSKNDILKTAINTLSNVFGKDGVGPKPKSNGHI